MIIETSFKQLILSLPMSFCKDDTSWCSGIGEHKVVVLNLKATLLLNTGAMTQLEFWFPLNHFFIRSDRKVSLLISCTRVEPLELLSLIT